MSRIDDKYDKYENNRNKMNRRQHRFLTQEEIAAGKKTQWSELEVTGQVSHLSPVLWKFNHLTGLYLNDNNLGRLPSDIGVLTNLQKLDLSSNKLRSLPHEIGNLINLRELLLHNNLLRSIPYEIGKLFNLQKLLAHNNPLNQEFKKIFNDSNSGGNGNGNNNITKLLTFLLDSLPVETPVPPERPWLPLGKPTKDKPNCLITVMCYNVLCDKYATRQMYGYCPSWALTWDYRKKNILAEIRHYTADIISLQEVETDQFYKFFLPELKRDGYEGIFSPKSRAKTMGEMDRKYVDGCAIFYRTSKFALVKEHLIEFNQLAMANAEGSDDMLNRVMPRDNIGLAALLKTKEAAWDNGLPSDQNQIEIPVLVCTAHIHWDPEYCDVKLIQIMMLSHELRNILEEASQTFRPGQKSEDSVQLLLCGDFNSLPDSGVIDFLSTGRVSPDHQDFKDLPYKSVLSKISNNEKPNEFTHSFKLASAYNHDVMPQTNYTYQFKGIIDYIFYSKDTMTPLGLLGPIAKEWFEDNKILGCPHPHIPSDHFPLLVELELLPNHQSPMNGMINRR